MVLEWSAFNIKRRGVINFTTYETGGSNSSKLWLQGTCSCKKPSLGCFKTDLPKQISNDQTGFNKNKTQTAVTNICLNCIPFMNLTFRMLQHTSSEVIIIQLQINLNSKIIYRFRPA